KMSALTQADPVWTVEEISTQSVTGQGLGALDWLLYDDASTLNTNSNVCASGVAIAETLHDKAQIIANSWAENPWKSLQ
ncbi:iron-regulated protein A, partial [Vibrio parahaemolyticus]|nr:iron-regulated protein A [Vibrio parahaemolyticus]